MKVIKVGKIREQLVQDEKTWRTRWSERAICRKCGSELSLGWSDVYRELGRHTFDFEVWNLKFCCVHCGSIEIFKQTQVILADPRWTWDVRREYERYQTHEERSNRQE
ncbi:MAG: hypothetical protein PHT12_05740 [Patescibacteria group bacterium]|nr:hypothetical protein [Patescibacteria group bacterium]